MLYIDTETFSKQDIRKVGTYVYTANCTVLLCAWAIDDDPVQLWDLTISDIMPEKLKLALLNPNILIYAHNSNFDRNVLRHCLNIDIPISRWRDTMVKALSLSLPGSLERLSEIFALSVDQKKIVNGKKLINRFCKPAPKNRKVNRYDKFTHPSEWLKFSEYAKQDVVAMRTIDKILPNWNYQDTELDLWHLDQVINDRGLMIDSGGVNCAINLINLTIKNLHSELYNLTDGCVSKATEISKLIKYLKNNGIDTETLTKTDVTKLLKENISSNLRRILEIRQQTGKSSTAKYKKLQDATNKDGRLRGTLQFNGASRTGRWAGRLFQPQNLPRSTIGCTDIGRDAIVDKKVDLLYRHPMEVASSCLRSMITTPCDSHLVVADLASIEARILPWLVKDEKKLKVFRSELDVYKQEAANIYDVSYDQINKDQRFIGKIAVLSLGYQGGQKAFITMGANYGVNIDKDLALRIVRNWRNANKRIVRFWYDLEKIIINIIKYNTQGVYHRVSVSIDNNFLKIKLPSGRFLCYFQPSVDTGLRENQKGESYKKEQISYMGNNPYTKKWERIPSYGGKFVENITQGVARDIIAANLQSTENANYKIVSIVHDEILTEASLEAGAKDLTTLLSVTPEWGKSLPLAAEGYTAERYRK